MRKAKVYMLSELAGFFTETEDGYVFKYEISYLKEKTSKPVSLTLPLQNKPHISKTLFPLF